MQRLPDNLSFEPEKFKTFYNAQDRENYVPYGDLNNHNKKLASFLKLIFDHAKGENRIQ